MPALTCLLAPKSLHTANAVDLAVEVYTQRKQINKQPLVSDPVAIKAEPGEFRNFTSLTNARL